MIQFVLNRIKKPNKTSVCDLPEFRDLVQENTEKYYAKVVAYCSEQIVSDDFGIGATVVNFTKLMSRNSGTLIKSEVQHTDMVLTFEFSDAVTRDTAIDIFNNFIVVLENSYKPDRVREFECFYATAVPAND